jgi:DGQHR domain-containing protein
MKFRLTPFSQPAGDFHLAVMPAGYVIDISTADPRQYDPDRFRSTGGIQRTLSESRVREIADYCGTPDSAFPTAVILAVGGEHYRLNDDGTEVEFAGTGKFANIVDGQHRLAGLAKSGNLERFHLPVVLLLDATLEEQALLSQPSMASRPRSTRP